MSLAQIKCYGASSDESSDEEFCGFGSETQAVDVFSCNESDKLKHFRSFFGSSYVNQVPDPGYEAEKGDLAVIPEAEKFPGTDSTGGCSEMIYDSDGCEADVELPSNPETEKYSDADSTGESLEMISDSDDCFFGSESDSGSEEIIEPESKRTKKEIRKRDVAERRRLAHAAILEDCGCRKECGNLVSRDDRVDVNTTFWGLDAAGQKHFIRERVLRVPIKRRSRNKFQDDSLRKHHSYKFHIRTVASDEAPSVCRKFFLNTLGYRDHCGNIIYRMVDDTEDNGVAGPSVKRGKYVRSSEKRDSVETHIAKFNPTVSHYRRAHAPNRRYLPSDLTVKEMHRNYMETHDTGVTYEFYCRTLKDMNISIVKLGHEQCETCVSAIQHEKTSGHSKEAAQTNDMCTICEQYRNHLQLATSARKEYREDGDSIKPGYVVLAVDLQKVIQLPRLDGLKTVVFSQRLIAFNETFAPVGKYTQSTPVVACVWNEAVTGRASNDIIGCFHLVVNRLNNMEKLVLWLDNCAAQNKNWNLFLHLILLINSKNINLKELILKYFEPGHTFMAADSFHAAVEGSMKRNPPITYPDFRDIVGNAGKRVEVFDMLPEHFFPGIFNISQYVLNKAKPRPYIDSIRQVVVKKGSLEFNYSSSVDGNDMKSCRIVSEKQYRIISADDYDMETQLRKKTVPRGIDAERKTALLRTILPLVEENKKEFWLELPEGNEQDE